MELANNNLIKDNLSNISGVSVNIPPPPPQIQYLLVLR